MEILISLKLVRNLDLIIRVLVLIIVVLFVLKDGLILEFYVKNQNVI